MTITEVQIVPIKAQDGLVAIASVIFDSSLYLGSIGIVTRLNGGYRLVYPTKKVADRNLNVFYPISREFALAVEQEVVKQFEEVMKKYDRHNSFNS